MSKFSGRSSDTATDQWLPPVCELYVAHCWRGDGEGARVYITGRFVVLRGDIAKVGTPRCCRVSRGVKYGTHESLLYGDHVRRITGLLFGHEHSCTWMNDFLAKNAGLLAQLDGAAVTGGPAA